MKCQFVFGRRFKRSFGFLLVKVDFMSLNLSNIPVLKLWLFLLNFFEKCLGNLRLFGHSRLWNSCLMLCWRLLILNTARREIRVPRSTAFVKGFALFGGIAVVYRLIYALIKVLISLFSQHIQTIAH